MPSISRCLEYNKEDWRCTRMLGHNGCHHAQGWWGNPLTGPCRTPKLYRLKGDGE